MEVTPGKSRLPSPAPRPPGPASSRRHGGGLFLPILPALGTLGYFLQGGHSLGQKELSEPPPGATRRTMHPLTNGCDDAAVPELGPIQGGQGCHSRLGQLILEKTPRQTIRPAQRYWAPSIAGPGSPRARQGDPGACTPQNWGPRRERRAF